MKLPSSSSLLLSLVVSSSSSSLSALAAPTGDCSESSSPAPVPVKRGDPIVHTDSTSTNCSIIFFSDTTIDHLQNRDLLGDVSGILAPLLSDPLKKLLGLPPAGDDKGNGKPPKARGNPSLPVNDMVQQAGKLAHVRIATRAEVSDPDDDPSSPAAAAPDNGTQPSAAPAATPQPPSAPGLPKPPQLPGVIPSVGAPSPSAPVGRRDIGGVPEVHMFSPNLPRNPPNTPVQRQLLPVPVPVQLPGQ
jgi:hypothetical protein